MFLDPNILSDDGTVALRGEGYTARPTGVPGPSLAALKDQTECGPYCRTDAHAVSGKLIYAQ